MGGQWTGCISAARMEVEEGVGFPLAQRLVRQFRVPGPGSRRGRVLDLPCLSHSFASF